MNKELLKSKKNVIGQEKNEGLQDDVLQACREVQLATGGYEADVYRRTRTSHHSGCLQGGTWIAHVSLLSRGSIKEDIDTTRMQYATLNQVLKYGTIGFVRLCHKACWRVLLGT